MITLNNGVLLGVIIPTPVPVPRVTVLLENTNIRAGDATRYRVVRPASAGQTFEVAGQSANCTWLQVVESGSVIGWISGNPAYVAIDQPCVSLPQILPRRVRLQRYKWWRKDALRLSINLDLQCASTCNAMMVGVTQLRLPPMRAASIA